MLIFFINSASNIATHFKVSKIIIGLTIVAFGTSIPEFAISVKSLIVGNKNIVLGNVIGSNILNILLILGVSSFYKPLKIKTSSVKKEIPMLILMTLLFSILLIFNNSFTRMDAIIIVLFFLIFINYLIGMIKNKKNLEKSIGNTKLSISILLVILGIISIIIGSNLVVDNASFIAKNIGVSDRIIGLTIIALGTSIPELVTNITATKKGEYDIVIGNIVGSNVLNIGLVIGIPVLFLDGINIITFNYIDLFVMIISSILLLLFSKNDYQISRNEGFILLLMFTIYYSYVIFNA